MNKFVWVALAIILFGTSFAISYSYFIRNDEKVEAEIAVDRAPTVTWYTSIPQIQAERLANAFKAETGVDVQIVRNSTFIIRDRLMPETENGTTEADVLTIAPPTSLLAR